MLIATMPNVLQIVATVIIVAIFIIYGLPPLLYAITNITSLSLNAGVDMTSIIVPVLPHLFGLLVVLVLGLGAFAMVVQTVQSNNARDVLIKAPGVYSYEQQLLVGN
jgi:hypothetical protein